MEHLGKQIPLMLTERFQRYGMTPLVWLRLNLTVSVGMEMCQNTDKISYHRVLTRLAWMMQRMAI